MPRFYKHADGTFSALGDDDAPPPDGLRVPDDWTVEVYCHRSSPLLDAVPSEAVCLRPHYWTATLGEWWAADKLARGIARGERYRRWARSRHVKEAR